MSSTGRTVRLGAGGECCKECYKAAQRESWTKDPEVQAFRREILDRWRDEGLKT